MHTGACQAACTMPPLSLARVARPASSWAGRCHAAGPADPTPCGRLPPYRQVQVPGAGRGLVASERIPAGAKVLEEKPFLAYPSAALLSKVCYLCLAKTDDAKALSKAGKRFCSSSCAEAAWGSFLKAESRASPTELYNLFYERDGVMPMMAARAVFAWAQQGPDGKAAPAALGIGSLCRTSTGTFPPGRPPATWLRAWELLLASLAASPEDPASTMQGRRGRETFAEPLTSERAAEARELFFDALSAIHVNVFQVHYPTFVLAGGVHLNAGALLSPAPWRALCSLNGLALYRQASLFNHSCDPNVEASFPGQDATIEFVAKRSIKIDEPLCISYISTSLAARRRQDDLQQCYGFRCRCERCIEELAGGDRDPLYWH